MKKVDLSEKSNDPSQGTRKTRRKKGKKKQWKSE
jgi:hypothetical protein